MAIAPEDYVLQVRRELAEATEDLLSDETIVQQLKKAAKVLEPYEADEDIKVQGIIALGTYFSYVAYTSMAERALGAVPATSELRVKELKKIAHMIISQFALVDEELRFKEVELQGWGVELRESVLSE